MVGFCQNIRHQEQVETVSALISSDSVTGFVMWSIEKRNIVEGSLRTSLASLRSALWHHPKYQDLYFEWVKPLLKQLQPRLRSEIDRRKHKKQISHAAAESIAPKIRAERLKEKTSDAVDLALSPRDELLMLWLTILPWRVRNLRECRLTGGAHPNLYRGPVVSFAALTRPKWIVEQEENFSGTPVWQIHFAEVETKGKREVTGYLTRELAVKLDEYLEHRGALVPPDDQIRGRYS